MHHCVGLGGKGRGKARRYRPETDPNLARVLATWHNLPPAIRRAILALIET